MATRFTWLGVIALLVFIWSGEAKAHTVGVSHGEYLLVEGKLYAGVTFARRELAAALPWLGARDDASDLLAFEQQKDALGRWLVERLVASAGHEPCSGAFDGMRFDGDGVAFALSYACANGVTNVDLDARFVSELARGHRHLASLSVADARREAVATRDRTNLSFGEASSRPQLAPLVRMGIEHILTGYDHLLFLVGLVLVGGPLRSLVGAITAFTVAHSITLALAAFGVWAPSPGIVEPCIALSIAYVGIENWFARDARGRWRVTFPFGLVHGFGFAGALGEIALARSEIRGALFAFNLGVELGQLAVLAIALPLILLAHKKLVHKKLVWERVCTAAIALTGVVWFVVRLRSSV